MEMGTIISEIWKLPWYKVMIIAAADDVMLFFKMWWLWLGVPVLIFLIVAVLSARRS